MKIIYADEFTFSSFIILKSKIHMKKFYFKEEFSLDTLISLFESNYMNNDLSISFLNHFS